MGRMWLVIMALITVGGCRMITVSVRVIVVRRRTSIDVAMSPCCVRPDNQCGQNKSNCENNITQLHLLLPEGGILTQALKA